MSFTRGIVVLQEAIDLPCLKPRSRAPIQFIYGLLVVVAKLLLTLFCQLLHFMKTRCHLQKTAAAAAYSTETLFSRDFNFVENAALGKVKNPSLRTTNYLHGHLLVIYLLALFEL